MWRTTINKLLTKKEYTKYIYGFYNNNIIYISDLRFVVKDDSLRRLVCSIVKDNKDARLISRILYKRYRMEQIVLIVYSLFVFGIITAVLLYTKLI